MGSLDYLDYMVRRAPVRGARSSAYAPKALTTPISYFLFRGLIPTRVDEATGLSVCSIFGLPSNSVAFYHNECCVAASLPDFRSRRGDVSDGNAYAVALRCARIWFCLLGSYVFFFLLLFVNKILRRGVLGTL